MGNFRACEGDDAAWYGVTIVADFVDPVSKVVFQMTASESVCCHPINYGEEIGLIIDKLTNEVLECQNNGSKITKWLPPIIIKL